MTTPTISPPTPPTPPGFYYRASDADAHPHGMRMVILRSGGGYSRGVVSHVLSVNRYQVMRVAVDVGGGRGKEINLKHIPEGATEMRVHVDARGLADDEFERMWDALPPLDG